LPLTRAVSHSHYSDEAQKLVAEFQRSSANSKSLRFLEFKQRVIVVEAIQAAWNMLAKARKKETGTGFYVPEAQYKAIKQSEDPSSC
jgi:hypothetical protein